MPQEETTTSVGLSERTFSTLYTPRELALASIYIRWGGHRCLFPQRPSQHVPTRGNHRRLIPQRFHFPLATSFIHSIDSSTTWRTKSATCSHLRPRLFPQRRGRTIVATSCLRRLFPSLGVRSHVRFLGRQRLFTAEAPAPSSPLVSEAPPIALRSLPHEIPGTSAPLPAEVPVPQPFEPVPAEAPIPKSLRVLLGSEVALARVSTAISASSNKGSSCIAPSLSVYRTARTARPSTPSSVPGALGPTRQLAPSVLFVYRAEDPQLPLSQSLSTAPACRARAHQSGSISQRVCRSPAPALALGPIDPPAAGSHGRSTFFPRSSTFFLKAHSFDIFPLSHRFKEPLSMSFSSAALSKAKCRKALHLLSRLAARIHHLRRLTTGVPFATTCSRNGFQLRRSLQNDRTKWERCCCRQHPLVLSLTPAMASHVLGFHPIVPHPCSLVKGVFEPSDRGSLSQHRHQQTNRVAPVQPLLGCSFNQDRRTWFVHREIVQVCDCALDGLFQFVSLW